jgi:hypothetical protein
MWKLLVLGCTLALGACASTPSDPLDRIAERAVADRDLIEACTPRTGSRLAQRSCIRHGTRVRVYGANGDAPLNALWLDPMINVVPVP